MIPRNEVATKLLRGQIRALVIVMSQQGFFRGGDAESAAEFTLEQNTSCPFWKTLGKQRTSIGQYIMPT